jgi:feruloyl-CoA synthase
VGPLRAAFIDHCAPYVHDVVIAGIDQDYIGALIFPDVDACRALVGDASLSAADVLARPEVRAHFTALLRDFAKKSTGSSVRIARAILLVDGPSIDKGEMTDKGSINQRAVLGNRASLVAALYAGEPSDIVLSADVKR